MEIELVIPIVAIVSLFVILPGMTFHYLTKWRSQKTLMPNDEQMLEDLWRSAKAMERRIDTLERLITDQEEELERKARRSHPTADDYS